MSKDNTERKGMLNLAHCRDGGTVGGYLFADTSGKLLLYSLQTCYQFSLQNNNSYLRCIKYDD